MDIWHQTGLPLPHSSHYTPVARHAPAQPAPALPSLPPSSRSQLYLSRQLAQLHPELTMPMFRYSRLYFTPPFTISISSEICARLQTARPVARQNLLQVPI